MEFIKKFISNLTAKVLSGIAVLKLYLGYETEVPAEYAEIADIDERAQAITETVVKTCTTVFLIVMSCILVNEFFFIILLLLEIIAIYYGLNYLVKSLFKEEKTEDTKLVYGEY